MIVLVSNGGEYSDHRLYFVEAGSVDQVKRLLETVKDDFGGDCDPDAELVGRRASVVGITTELVWLETTRVAPGTATIEREHVGAADVCPGARGLRGGGAGGYGRHPNERARVNRTRTYHA